MQRDEITQETADWVSLATLTISLKKMKTDAPLQTGHGKTHKASIKKFHLFKEEKAL